MITEEASTLVSAVAEFSYEEAFSRNLGWVTEWEQQALRFKRVAIAGMGGVGGFHLLTLARFGIGAFNIADCDNFELVNFNRQVGATLAAIGRPKVEVMAEMAWDINPELRIARFESGLTEANLDDFLAGADLCVDGLDFFVLDIRRRLNARCRQLGVPVINAAPLGMGTAFLIFVPGGMSFEEWFRLDGLSEDQQYISYLVGMAPRALHRGYLVDPTRVDLRGHRGPSTVAGCELCAGVASVEAIKILLSRGPIRAVPYYHHFDAYCGRWVVKKRRGGNNNPVQRLKIALTRHFTARISRQRTDRKTCAAPATDVEKILDCARWAPSGDNTQPWRFEIVNQDKVVVHLVHQVDDLYDYRDGEPTLLSGGMLLELMRIAASRWGRNLEWIYQGRCDDTHRIAVSLPLASRMAVDPLFSYVPMRSVDRQRYRLRPLSQEEKAALAASLGPELQIEWYETLRQRWRLARLAARATAVRLTTPEAFMVHQRVLDWDRSYSPDRIPAAAAGLSRASLGPMRWAMKNWGRMQLLNWAGGFIGAQIEMDYVPAVFSAAFFILRLNPATASSGERPVRLLTAAQKIQRFWLTATRLGLAMQPGLATLIFAEYGSSPIAFTTNHPALRRARALSVKAAALFGQNHDDDIFLGRIGQPRQHEIRCRSIRHPLSDLMVTTQGEIAGTATGEPLEPLQAAS